MSLSNLNGWQRLGVFISTLIAVPSFLVGYQDNKSAYLYYEVPEQFQKLTGQEFIDKVYWDAHGKEEELNGCILSTTSVTPEGSSLEIPAEEAVGDTVSVSKSDTISTHATITCERNTERAIYLSIWYALVPFMIVFGFGYVLAWIIAGFRNVKKA